MLILTRRVGETLRIGSDVSVTVLGMRGRQVRLGITAPKTMTVHREELYERLRHERVLRAEGAFPMSLPAKSEKRLEWGGPKSS